MELKASEFGVVLSVDALKLSRQSPLGCLLYTSPSPRD